MTSLLLSIALLTTGLHLILAQQSEVKEWWQHAVIYQIYPRSFKDSNDDGSGDLQGIISKLDHLKDINVNAIWISPIYPSPQVDGGYDISDFTAIDPIYGTMADFEELVAKAGEMGIKIIMDLVPNHSSDEHEWFKKSIKKEGKYADYYVWKDGKGENKDQPPTNWNSVFAGSAWTYNDERGQFYLHQFAKQQPDLNYENPDVVQEMKNVITFWLDKGVAGFRVDAIAHLFEVYEDEPPANTGGDETSHSYYDHIYSMDDDRTFDMVYQWRELIDAYSKDKNHGIQRFFMTEAYSDVKVVMRYYEGDDGKLGANFPFNFDLIGGLNANTDARDIAYYIHHWFSYMPSGFTPNWVLGNHDQHRVATRLGDQQRANMMNMLTSVLPGVMITYNGEEIGMENGEVTFEEGKDPSGCIAGEDGFESISRDFQRTPYQWDNTANAGFTSSEAKPWLPVSEKYVENNLEKQRGEKASIYQNYKALTAFRGTSKTLAEGTWEIYSINEDGILTIRKHPEEEAVIFVCHLGKTENNFELKLTDYGYEPSSQTLDVIASNVADKFESQIELSESVISIKPKEAFVLKSNAATLTMSLILLLVSLFTFIL